MTQVLTFKPKRRDIQYGAAPKHLVESVRKQLRALVEQKNLDEHLGTIARFANQADDMLMCVKAPEAVLKSEHQVTVPDVPTSPGDAETYGASLLRQLVPAIQNYHKAAHETPEALVQAIILARRSGMPDVAGELEQKLLGRKLDGPRPVSKDPFGIENYLPPVTPVESPAPTKTMNGAGST